MHLRRLLFTSLFAVCSLILTAIAHAQWDPSDYYVEEVLSSIGNYSYSAGANGGDVDAVSPTSSSPGYSLIKVKFGRGYYAAPGTPSLTITPKGDLTGEKSGGGGTALSRLSITWGSNQEQTKSTDDSNPYDATVTCSTTSVSAPYTPAYLSGTAKVDYSTSGSSWAHAFVYFTP